MICRGNNKTFIETDRINRYYQCHINKTFKLKTKIDKIILGILIHSNFITDIVSDTFSHVTSVFE